jgi:hypothetical protein
MEEKKVRQEGYKKSRMPFHLTGMVSTESDAVGKSEKEATNSARLSPLKRSYSPIGTTLGQRETRPLTSELTSLSRNQSHAVNAVHMHIQENAKVPTFNQTIDRSNSSRPSEIEKTESNAFSMELFLNKESTHRRSIEQNYEILGSLLSDVGTDDKRRQFAEDNITESDSKVLEVDDPQMEIDALSTSIDPTPWSEIEKQIHIDDRKDQETTKKSVPPPAGHPYHFNYYPYSRHQPLPIPGTPISLKQNDQTTTQKKSGENSDEATMAQAIATAAAIASRSGVPTRPIPQPTHIPVTSLIQPPPYTKAQQTTPLRSTHSGNTSRHYQHQRVAYSSPQHSVTHTTSRASVLAAANKKSRYGFGGNHTVPSVPAPPPMTKGRFGKIGYDKAATLLTVPTLPVGHIPPPNSGAAYERKKQRAKNARVKLNEAIEHLSVAMSLAGSQSKQRNQFLSTRIAMTNDRPKTLETSEACAKLAEQAKKWDRPSFVGTAASLVQELNSQCECLTRELIALHQRIDSRGNGHNISNGDSLTPHSVHKRHENPVTSSNGLECQDFKRIKTSLGDENGELILSEGSQIIDTTMDERTIFGGAKLFLDPVSMVRCSCVSRQWRHMGAFDDDDTWLNLAVRRFNFYNVRQWTEKLEDCGHDTSKKHTKQMLYRSMSLANVSPHFNQDNLCLLGDAKIPGKVSGWVFMVKRSNGETLRSVKIDPASPAPKNGIYQSRPVVELRILIQNTGLASQPVIIRNQQISVDVSTRRTGGELKEISWDGRFSKVVKNLDGNIRQSPIEQSKFNISRDLCHLNLFEAVIVEVYINACGCSTTTKFQQRSNFTKLLVSLNGSTVPIVIPFLRDVSLSSN